MQCKEKAKQPTPNTLILAWHEFEDSKNPTPIPVSSMADRNVPTAADVFEQLHTIMGAEEACT